MSSSRHSAWAEPQVTIVIKNMSEPRGADRSSGASRKRHSTPDKPGYLSTPVARRTRIDTAIDIECITNKLRNQKRIAKSGHGINNRLWK